MEKIQFTSTLTLSQEQVLDLAHFLGYLDEVYGDPVFIEGVLNKIPNPESAKSFLDRKAKEYIRAFTEGWSNSLVEKEIATNIKPQVEVDIKKPIDDALDIKNVAIK